MDIAIAAAIALVGIIIAMLIGVVIHKKQLATAFENAREESRRILEEARKEAELLERDAVKEAREETQKRRREFEQEFSKRRSELAKFENKVKQREQNLEKKFAIIEKKESDLDKTTNDLQQEEQRYKRLITECEKTLDQSRRTLQNIANLTQEEAKRELIKSLEEEAKKEASERLRQIEQETAAEAENRARAAVSLAVQRISGEYVNDSTISVVSLPSDEMKGRIIGREGRNIRAIEQMTGVDLIIDDTPEAVIISCFNPIRREIAKISLEKLIGDGRIHPARIDETVKRVKSEFDQVLRENGEQAAFDAGITDLHPELLKRLGMLRYRTTGQQTVLQHSVEVSHICGIMASEMGLNAKKAKRAGLLHDLGKSVDQETEGHHSVLGSELAAKHGEIDVIVDAIRLHHSEDLSTADPYAVILHAANVLSANRPGARKEVLESYIKRLEDMEAIVKSFNGIETAFVIQAGREVRALVTPVGVSDTEITDLSHEIAHKLRNELTFPGQIKVTVVRESRAFDYAK